MHTAWSVFSYLCTNLIKIYILMKKLILIIAVLATVCQLALAGEFSAMRGVWASDSTEAVVTDHACIFFENTPTGLRAFLDVPSYNIHSRTVFADSTFISDETTPIVLSLEGKKLKIGDKTLMKVEDITTCEPYERPAATSKFDIGRLLQEWRLGAAYGREGEFTFCEINTNRHMFVYMLNPTMTYIRAAATRNNNNGTLFFQNIRMMQNGNTGELTSHMMPGNLAIARDDLAIDDSKFQPDKCTFTSDGGIYWSFISFSPDEILINGCSETYTVQRGASPDTKDEYFKYTPYSSESGALHIFH